MNLITLTKEAKAHLLEKIQKLNSGNDAGFRLSIKKTGCSGYSYVPEVVSKGEDQDTHFIEQGIHVYLDPDCEPLIKGVIVDYVSQGAMQKKLVFINPNEKNRCGCGESFTIE